MQDSKPYYVVPGLTMYSLNVGSNLLVKFASAQTIHKITQNKMLGLSYRKVSLVLHTSYHA